MYKLEYKLDYQNKTIYEDKEGLTIELLESVDRFVIAIHDYGNSVYIEENGVIQLYNVLNKKFQGNGYE